MKARIAIVLAVVGLALAVAPVVGAATSSGTIGFYSTGSAYCWDSSRLEATPPSMLPAANAPISFVGGGQDVGYRAVLQRWGSAGWYDFRISSLQTQFAGYTIIDGSLWRDSATGTYSTGLPPFSMTGLHGYFRVVYRLYWFLNGKVSGYVQAEANGHFDVRQSTFGVPGARSYYWCI
jgi:hypothetical protein